MKAIAAPPVHRAPWVVSVCAASLIALAGCAGSPEHQSTGELVENEALVALVKTELAQRDLETLLDVEVESFRNVVQLSGFVETADEKRIAGEAAASVDGVVEVRNDLIVKAEI